jgi:hypothetical protein
VEAGGDILYRESATANISFGSSRTLITGNYNFVTSTHQTYNPSIVILVTDQSSTNLKVAGFLGTDGPAAATLVASTRSQDAVDLGVKPITLPQLQAYPNPFTNQSTLQFALPANSEYTLTLYDAKGARIRLLHQGNALANELKTVEVDAARLNQGLYFARLQTSHGTQTIRLMLHR